MIQLFIILYRISHKLSLSNKTIKILGLPIRILYLFYASYIIGFELHERATIGKNFKIWHRGHGSVIHPNSIIGDNVSIRHNTTIGSTQIGTTGTQKAPIIGDNVHIGANCCIIGEIKIGNNSIIGAGSVVTKDIPANCIAAGNPCRILKILD